jgi:hypothetical protein
LGKGFRGDQNLTFWTVALMDEQRLRMRRSCRNASVLILKYLVRRSDGSRMSSLILAIGYNSLVQPCASSPMPILEKLVRSPSYNSSSRWRKVWPSLMPPPAPSCFVAALLIENSFSLLWRSGGRGKGLAMEGGQVFFVFPARYWSNRSFHRFPFVLHQD